MTDELDFQAEPEAVEPGVGQRLRLARETAGLDLTQIAAETRIPERHLIAIESGDFEQLPARTYAVGFSRSYARFVGLDEKEIAAAVREELAAHGAQEREMRQEIEPGDPARVPSRGLAWLAALAVVLLVAGGFSFYRSYVAPGSGPGSLIAEQERDQARLAAAERADAQQDEQASQGLDPEGEVVFTALEEGIWVKFYDRYERQLMQKQMARDERYVIPADAEGPQIWTGRPDAFAITIGGQAIPKLAEEDRTIRDVPVDARSLIAFAEQSEAEPEQTVAATPAAQPTAAPPRPRPAAVASSPTPRPTVTQAASAEPRVAATPVPTPAVTAATTPSPTPEPAAQEQTEAAEVGQSAEGDAPTVDNSAT